VIGEVSSRTFIPRRPIGALSVTGKQVTGLLPACTHHPSGTGSLNSRNAVQHADGNRNKYRLSFYFMA
jgi:hypothetical protein